MTEETAPLRAAESRMPATQTPAGDGSGSGSGSTESARDAATSDGNEQLQAKPVVTKTAAAQRKDSASEGPSNHPRFASANRLVGDFVPKTFQQRYQRNNKRGGLKNLRCFPECGVQHKERGFCGRAVMIRLKREKKIGGNAPKLVCWAHFVPATQDYAFSIGQSVEVSTILSKERTKQNPLKQWIRGKEMEVSNVRFLDCVNE